MYSWSHSVRPTTCSYLKNANLTEVWAKKRQLGINSRVLSGSIVFPSGFSFSHSLSASFSSGRAWPNLNSLDNIPKVRKPSWAELISNQPGRCECAAWRGVSEKRGEEQEEEEEKKARDRTACKQARTRGGLRDQRRVDPETLNTKRHQSNTKKILLPLRQMIEGQDK